MEYFFWEKIILIFLRINFYNLWITFKKISSCVTVKTERDMKKRQRMILKEKKKIYYGEHWCEGYYGKNKIWRSIVRQYTRNGLKALPHKKECPAKLSRRDLPKSHTVLYRKWALSLLWLFAIPRKKKAALWDGVVGKWEDKMEGEDLRRRKG